ncbi:MAG: type II toxin-antitoxin system YafQ family toxin [Flavobacteriaceae bacterium]|nr:type II toxin-antitoxin system YafQ family toxin [Flavobacteriaceae bacterium]
MYSLELTTRFKKDIKKLKKNNSKDFELTAIFLRNLQAKGFEGISTQMRPHKLKGNFKENWECHIKPDLLIIWIQIEDPKTIKLIRLGSHSELF